MTPKEKAKELVSLFIKFSLPDDEDGKWESWQLKRRKNAKQCALICCEEIIKEPRMFDSEQVKYSDGYYARSYYEVPNKFWQQVKHEIEKL
jgi:hypothetical protein